MRRSNCYYHRRWRIYEGHDILLYCVKNLVPRYVLNPLYSVYAKLLIQPPLTLSDKRARHLLCQLVLPNSVKEWSSKYTAAWRFDDSLSTICREAVFFAAMISLSLISIYSAVLVERLCSTTQDLPLHLLALRQFWKLGVKFPIHQQSCGIISTMLRHEDVEAYTHAIDIKAK